MEFSPPLEEARFIRRYKRFFADVELDDGSVLTIHCANTGSMRGCLNPGSPCWFSRSNNPKRKLPGTLELVTTEGGRFAGVNTARTNHLVVEAILSGLVCGLRDYTELATEQRYGEEGSRVDILLTGADSPCYVEVKNVTLEAPGRQGLFPDAVTDRGAKHLRELARMAKAGQRAVLFYCAQLSETDELGVAGDIDPMYAETLRLAQKAGVEVMAWGCDLSPSGIAISRELAFMPP